MLFDVGETLVHPAPSFPGLFARVLAEAGYDREDAAVVEASAAVLRGFSDAASAGNRWTLSIDASRAFWAQVYGSMLERLDLPSDDGLCDELYATFTDLGNYALFDDVLPALDDLEAPGRVLGLVSNFEAWLGDLLGRLGVLERFSVRVISGIDGLEKPEPAIYRLALDRAGVRAERAAFVGDNPEFDVVPPAALGMFPVLIDRRGRHPDHPGARITDLRELAGVLEAA